MTFTGELGALTPEQERHWQELYERFGTRVQQSPAYARAVRAAGRRVLVVLADGAALALTQDGEFCTALCDDQPLLAGEPGPEPLARLVDAVHRSAGVPVYLPLVDAGYADCADCVHRVGARASGPFTAWARPPNSLVDWSRDGADLWERALARGNSQLRRKRRLVERDGLTLSAGAAGPRAAEDMLRVDDRSWKADRGQSMRSRGGQDRLYRRLVEDGTLTAAFLRDGDRPVAFRLDARVKDRVMCLKWSYDEAYRRYSPGLHLLTEGLRREWGGARGVRVVDLHGGPDTLKDLLYSARSPRVDLWYGDPELGARRAAERAAFDARVAGAHDHGKGLRHAFG
ncbi:GNAT family N-acetyltransferase [Streptomyces sp. LP05-1]|uniref:GNAT family N-acetyltransferase n=1 Tax=Streptomyces pyxinae TaxID=2970734 RepID=A0ABT2CK32_9ACTN|nr:GNAT family N-acetyltransferase [Streptomyces sp. LP05-1]MCS0636934.1 GNAT family N-acetyltransferase [Streptomyces sp. LP05-1]